MGDSIVAVITPYISVGALIISLLAFVESIRSRRQRTKEQRLNREMERCNQAFNQLFFDSSDMNQAAIRFNKLLAVKTILGKNLVNLKEKDLEELLKQLEEVSEDYDKVSGKRLNQHFEGVGETSVLYDIHDFSPRLDGLFDEVKKRTIEYNRKLQKKSRRI